MRLVCLLTVLVLSLLGCGEPSNAADGGDAAVGPAEWELVECELEERIGYAPTGVDGPSIPISITRAWNAYFSVPLDAKVSISLCNYYYQQDGVFRPQEELGYPTDGCRTIDYGLEVEKGNGDFRVLCTQEDIDFHNFCDYQSVPCDIDDLPTHTVHGWEEIYILVEPETAL